MIEIIIPGKVTAKGHIEGYENYIALSDGQIFSIRSNKMLKQTETKDGYLKVSLFKNGKGCTKKTHSFIAKTLIPNPDNKPQINHKNGDKQDNRIENLEWVTQQENMDHAVATGLVSSEKAKAGYQVKLEKYGEEYLSNIARSNGSKADHKKAQQTKIERYGQEKIREQALKASANSIKSLIKPTKIINSQTGQVVGVYESRKEAGRILGVEGKRVSEAIRSNRLIHRIYKVEDAKDD